MKMKLIHGKYFPGCVAYVMDVKNAGKVKEPEIICGTVTSDRPSEIARELTATQRIRPDIRKPVWHVPLSMPAGERPLSSGVWETVATEFMKRMGFPEDTVWIAVRHWDRAHDHIHIIASRISLSGKVHLSQNEVYKGIDVTQSMERDLGLTRTKGLDYEIRGESMGERKMQERTGETSVKRELKSLIDQALGYNPTRNQYVRLLNAAGVKVFVNESENGKVNGTSYTYKGFAIKGSQLGKRYGWQRLSDRLMPEIEEMTRGCHADTRRKAIVRQERGRTR